MKPLADRNEHWPYSKIEAMAIRNYFDPPSQRALNIAVKAAGNFVDLYDPKRKRPNVRVEVEDLGAALTAMRRALALSAAAESHLKRYRQPSAANDPIENGKLHSLLHQFAFENRRAFLDLPPKTSAGRSENLLEKWMIREFKEAFKAGHDGVTPKTGELNFLKLCRDPLVRMKLLFKISDKALRDKAGRRNRLKNTSIDPFD